MTQSPSSKADRVASVDLIRSNTHFVRKDKWSWPDLQPLTAKIEPKPYPLGALPETLRLAVQEVADFVQAPLPLVVTSALGALSLAAQAHGDVKRAERLQGPISLFLLVIADSGERKTTCDSFFTPVIRDYEAQQAELAKPELKQYDAAFSAWNAERDGILSKIKEAGRSGKPSEDEKSRLLDLERKKPARPRVPRLLYSDITPEQLGYLLAKSWPSGGVVSSEAGTVFGSHGMGTDSVMRNLALLNQLWDGDVVRSDRRTVESWVAHAARLTMGLQVQEAVLRAFFDKCGALARGTGFLARFLIAVPESTQGHRPFKDAPPAWPSLAVYHRRIAAILNSPVSITEDGALTLPVLAFSPDARRGWIAFHDAVEVELRNGGELQDVRDVAAKAADNAARLAALFHLFEGRHAYIDADSFSSASRIVAWHLHESLRFFGAQALPLELANAAMLDDWLIKYFRYERAEAIPTSSLLQRGPLRLRKKNLLDPALAVLTELGRARRVSRGKAQMIEINPALLGRGHE